MERINDNAYKIEWLGGYSVSATFNVSDITLFDVGNDDSGSNPFKKKKDGKDLSNIKRNHTNDPSMMPSRPITRAREKRLKETLNGLVQRT